MAEGAHKLAVSGLPADITGDELRHVFGTYGRVMDVQVQGVDASTGLPWAFVSYGDRQSGEDAIQVLHEQYKIRVDATKPINVYWNTEPTAPPPVAPAPPAMPALAPPALAPPAFVENKGPPVDGHKLFIGCLPEDITQEELKTVFGTYGEVTHIHIMKQNSMTGLRASFIYYSTRDAGEDAIKVLNNVYKIRVEATQPIQVRWGMDKDQGSFAKGTDPLGASFKLFVGNLPPDCNEDELRTCFGTYGEVTLVHMLPPHDNTGSKAALIFYRERYSGEDAIRLLDGQYKIRVDSTSPIVVKWGKDKEPKGVLPGAWDKGGWGKGAWDKGAWDKGYGKGWAGDPYMKGGWDKGWGKGWDDPKGWGKGWDKGGKGWWDAKGWDDGKGKGGWDVGKGKGPMPPPEEPNGKLYVANLPQDIADQALEYVFGAYGKVERVHIMSNKSVNGGVAAFVEFSLPDEAETAIATLSGKYEIRAGYGPILVRHANPRRPKPY